MASARPPVPLPVIVLLLLAALVAGVASADTRPGAGGLTSSGVNTIVVVVDDMDDFSCAETRRYLPESSPWLLARGRCFDDAVSDSPVCCPARAELQTGQLPHNNGVQRQHDARLFPYRHSVQHRLGEHGVATYGTGKFLNAVDPGAIARGDWPTGYQESDFWSSYRSYDYPLYDEQGRKYRPTERLHTTERTGRYLRDFVRRMAREDQPFHAYAAFVAPHYQAGLDGAKETERASFPVATPRNRHRTVPPFEQRLERDTSDKLVPFHRLERDRAFYADHHAARVRALYDVDHELAATFRLLEQEGIADRTAVIFVSDNGYSLGANGWTGKAVPYPASIEVPMLAYLPSAFGGGVVDRRPVGLVDVAATVYDLHDVEPPVLLDGVSLLEDHERAEQFLEFRNERSRFVLQESGTAAYRVPTWAMVRRGDQAYVEYYESSGELLRREYYADRAMEENLLAPTHRARRPPAALLDRFAERLRGYRTCAGTSSAPHAGNPCP